MGDKPTVVTDPSHILLLGEIRGQLMGIQRSITDNQQATNRRFEDLTAAVNRRIDDHQTAVHEGFEAHDDRIKSLEQQNIAARNKTVLTGAGVAGLVSGFIEIIKANV